MKHLQFWSQREPRVLGAYAKLMHVLWKGRSLQSTQLLLCICDGSFSPGIGAALTASSGFPNNPLWGIIYKTSGEVSCPILGRKEHSPSGVFRLTLVCFLLHSCFFEMAGRTMVCLSLFCCFVGLVLLPFLSTQVDGRSWEEKCRRKDLVFGPHCFDSSDVNMLGLVFPSYFCGCETRSFPGTPQPPQYLKKPKPLSYVSEKLVSMHAAGTACLALKAGACSTWETLSAMPDWEEISEGSPRFQARGQGGVIWKRKMASLFLGAKASYFSCQSKFWSGL